MALILVVEDEADARDVLAEVLEGKGHHVTRAASGGEAMDLLARREFDVVLTDLVMPRLSGLDLLRWMKDSELNCEVIVLTGYAEVPTAVEAMRLGAYHYLAKPWDATEVRELVAKAAEKRALRKENTQLKGLLARDEAPPVVGKSDSIRQLLSTVEQVAQSASPVLLQGETGTGKELIARTLHLRSQRPAGPFISVNCGAIPETLLESELFGHVKGAFSGAVASRSGLVEAADGGTLFLDEIGEMSAGMQVRLLRTLDSGEVRRVGSERIFRVDVRLVAASARDLEREVAAGRFRSDLYYRISTVVLRIPPLRERPKDIPPLVQHFAARPGRGRRPVRFSPEALALLSRYAWPGNVRELRNLVERLELLHPGSEITPELLPPEVRSGSSPETADPAQLSLSDVERLHVERVLQATGWNKSQAARVLRVDIKTLNKKIHDYAIRRG